MIGPQVFISHAPFLRKIICSPLVFKMVDEKRSMIGIIRSRQTNWMGHIMRGDSLLRTIIERRMEGKQKRERPRMMLLVWIIDVKNVFTFFIIFIKNAFFKVFYFWNVFNFLVEKFFLLLSPLKSY